MKVLGFSWEYFAIAGLVILFFKVQPQLEKMPWHFNILHWSFVVLFTLIGVNGFRFLIFFLKDRKEFQSLFSQPDHPFGPLWSCR